MASRSRVRFYIRLIVYIAVVVVLYVNRGGISWRNLTKNLRGTAPSDMTLIVAGRELAPSLIDRLIAHFQRDYPELTISVSSGGTNQALEDLLNDKASMAFLYRVPSADENELFRAADGDTAIVAAVAVGAVILVAGSATDAGPIDLDDFKRLLAGDLADRCDRFYVPDPNEGLWDAVRIEQGLAGHPEPTDSAVVYLSDAGAVLEAVRNDERAWGMMSSLNAPFDSVAELPGQVGLVPVRATPDSTPALPTYENVATGAYPLHHKLFVVCRENGDREGGKFLTHLASARGLRQIERAGVVPAKYVLREIYLSTEPVGE